MPTVNGSHWGRKQDKIMLVTFCDVRGNVYNEVLSQGEAIYQQIYKEILQHKLRPVREKRWELWQDKSCLLHHNNAPAHNAQIIWEFLVGSNIAELEQPPCSLDLTSCAFSLFPKLKAIKTGLSCLLVVLLLQCRNILCLHLVNVLSLLCFCRESLLLLRFL